MLIHWVYEETGGYKIYSNSTHYLSRASIVSPWLTNYFPVSPCLWGFTFYSGRVLKWTWVFKLAPHVVGQLLRVLPSVSTIYQVSIGFIPSPCNEGTKRGAFSIFNDWLRLIEVPRTNRLQKQHEHYCMHENLHWHYDPRSGDYSYQSMENVSRQISRWKKFLKKKIKKGANKTS